MLWKYIFNYSDVSYALISIRTSILSISFKNYLARGAWLAQSVACVTLDFGVVSLSPVLGIAIT